MNTLYRLDLLGNSQSLIIARQKIIELVYQYLIQNDYQKDQKRIEWMIEH